MLPQNVAGAGGSASGLSLAPITVGRPVVDQSSTISTLREQLREREQKITLLERDNQALQAKLKDIEESASSLAHALTDHSELTKNVYALMADDKDIAVKKLVEQSAQLTTQANERMAEVESQAKVHLDSQQQDLRNLHAQVAKLTSTIGLMDTEGKRLLVDNSRLQSNLEPCHATIN